MFGKSIARRPPRGPVLGHQRPVRARIEIRKRALPPQRVPPFRVAPAQKISRVRDRVNFLALLPPGKTTETEHAGKRVRRLQASHVAGPGVIKGQDR
eukprot:14609818-Heterocapsa_arctica.AAC.1